MFCCDHDRSGAMVKAPRANLPAGSRRLSRLQRACLRSIVHRPESAERPMSDRELIKELVNLYGFAVDTQRWDLFDRIFTDDVDADYTESAHWRDLETFKRDFGAFHDPFHSTQHCMMNHMVHVD